MKPLHQKLLIVRMVVNRITVNRSATELSALTIRLVLHAAFHRTHFGWMWLWKNVTFHHVRWGLMDSEMLQHLSASWSMPIGWKIIRIPEHYRTKLIKHQKLEKKVLMSLQHGSMIMGKNQNQTEWKTMQRSGCVQQLPLLYSNRTLQIEDSSISACRLACGPLEWLAVWSPLVTRW